MIKHGIGIIISILIAELVGALAGFFAGDINSMYKELVLPLLSPPGWLFPIVWIILYALMGIAAYLVFIRVNPLKKKALILYAVQLLVNFSWTILFFRFRMFGVGSFIALLLLVLVYMMYTTYRKISHVAANLTIPYLIWLFYATYLSFGIFVLNG